MTRESMDRIPQRPAQQPHQHMMATQPAGESAESLRFSGSVHGATITPCGCKKAKILDKLLGGREHDSSKEQTHGPQAIHRRTCGAWRQRPPRCWRSRTPPPPAEEHDARYTANEITQAGADFFGITTEAMAKAVQHVFGDLGEPDAYIKGDEGSGAFIVGLRYGSGFLIRKNAEPLQGLLERPVDRLRFRRQCRQDASP